MEQKDGLTPDGVILSEVQTKRRAGAGGLVTLSIGRVRISGLAKRAARKLKRNGRDVGR